MPCSCNPFERHLITLVILKLIVFHDSSTIIITFFQYFLKRYKFKVAGIIEPIPGKEPTPKELKGLIDIARKSDVVAIFTHIQLPDNAAHLLAESTGINVYTLDPIGGVDEIESYIDMLMYNTGIIMKAMK